MNLRKSKRFPVHHGSQESLLDPSCPSLTNPSDFFLLPQDHNLIMAEVLSVSPHHHHLHHQQSSSTSTSISASETAACGSIMAPAPTSEENAGLMLDSSPSSSFPPHMPISPLANFSCNSTTCEPSVLQRQEQLQRPGHILPQGCRDDVELSLLTFILEALRRSGLSCQGSEDQIKMDISRPTNVRHVAHVTFDRFNGFLGLPIEFQMEIPRRVPSASVSAFGVSAESMQCSYDRNGNSVPTILLLLQERLYDQGGLKAEGIFRINAENSQEELVRSDLNHGIVPYDIDVHCLAGLIKAWFRELPRGVLDSLSPEQVMQCNTEEQAVALVKTLPPMQAALLDWGINLMADVVQEEHFNKMNAHNIAMVFAPNMTQMSDPLTALMHAVQVMNLLKMLILRTLRDREEVLLDPRPTSTCSEPPSGNGRDNASKEAAAPSIISNRGEGNSQMIEETEVFLRSFHMRDSIGGYESAHDTEEMFMTRLQSKYEHDFSSERQGSSSTVSSSLDGNSNGSSPRLILPGELQGSPIPACWNSLPSKSELSNLVKDLTVKSEGIDQLAGRVKAW